MKKLNNLLESIAKPLIPITPWLLRLGLGTSFILHGIGKFPLPPEKMVTWFESMGYMSVSYTHLTLPTILLV